MKNYRIFFLIALIILTCTRYFASSTIRKAEQNTKKGDEYFAAGDVEKAVEMWKEALNCKRSAVLYEKIVMAQIIKNDLAKAKEWTDEGLTYFPNSVNLIFNQALINFYKEDLVSAMNSLDRVLKQNEYYPDAHFLKGLIYEKKGDTASARKEFIKEINVNPASKKAWQKVRGLTND